MNSPLTQRTRSRSLNAENGDVDAEGEVHKPRSKRRRRSISKSSVSRRSRAPSIPLFDPTADPGDELDPTVITMANICDDTGHGRISTKAVEIQRNHSSWKASNREKRARMRDLTEGKKYGRTGDDCGAMSSTLNANVPTGPSEQMGTGGEAVAGPSSVMLESTEVSSSRHASEAAGEDNTGNGFNYSAPLSTNRFNVQVRIGPNGETIIDEETLYVDRANDPDLANEEYTHIEESDQTKFVNSQSYSRKQRGARWSAPETELFYDALSQFGENYELISYVLPGRDRKSCKNKFKAEDKKNPNRITYCLNNRVPYDIQTLSRMTGRDFSGPTPEIRVPEPRRFGDDVPSTENSQPAKEDTSPAAPAKKKGRTPRVNDEGVEVLGDIDTFGKDGEDLPAGQSTLQ
ncbi:hypothetical protein BD410DRAFT_713240 [Rickenella mellea]|uniref:Uncharacterized protein n=1 Tax=Rickenella mellea TaxID=50990 RepID=A0A4Y7QM00_9AGAM|nr:hypothetical protein BD410DRAFT_713240 [Rickenella mellea]